DDARSINTYLAVGQPPRHIRHYLPIPPHITETGAHRAKPVYFCLVIQDGRPRHSGGYRRRQGRKVERPSEVIGQCIVVPFEGTLNVGLKPHDNERGILPIVADLASTDETVRRRSVGGR